jgi:hypothetical protein
MVLRFQRVTPIVSHLLPRPDDLRVTHEHNGQTDTRKSQDWMLNLQILTSGGFR